MAARSPLVYLHGADAPPTAALELLARGSRVVTAETLAAVDLAAFDLVASAAAGAAALEFALREPARVTALVLEAPPAIDADARLAGLTTPTLVLCGTADDAASAAQACRYRSVLPNAHLVYVYAAGRAIGRDRPEAFAEVVADFLERHEAFVIRRTETVIHP